MIKLWVVAFTFTAGLFLPSHLPAADVTTSTSKASSTTSIPATAKPLKKSTAKFNLRHQQNLQRIKEGPVDLLFLGDSITDRWSSSPLVWKANFAKWNPANFGVGGDRTENVLWRITNGELEGIEPKVIVLMIGTNNTHSAEPPDIVTGIKTIISTIQKKLPETKVLLLAVFPREPRMRDGKLYTMPLEKVREVNKHLPALAEEGKVRYLDIGDKFLVNGKVPKDIMPDGVHLSEKGYEIWAEAIVPVLEEMMQ